MTQTEKDKLIKELQETLAKVEKIEVDEPKQSKRWKPEHNEIYWHVYDGAVYQSHWHDENYDNWRYKTDNCFKTEEDAKEYKKQIEHTAHYKNYIEEHSEPLDWKDEDSNQEKYLAFFDFRNHNIGVDWCHLIKKQGAIYASSEQIIRDAIKEIGEDNFKKYVLGVK